jgi:hypothetical protein
MPESLTGPCVARTRWTNPPYCLLAFPPLFISVAHAPRAGTKAGRDRARLVGEEHAMLLIGLAAFYGAQCRWAIKPAVNPGALVAAEWTLGRALVMRPSAPSNRQVLSSRESPMAHPSNAAATRPTVASAATERRDWLDHKLDDSLIREEKVKDFEGLTLRNGNVSFSLTNVPINRTFVS